MIDSEALAIVYGLASALSWGAGDFSGGVATRRANVYGVLLVSQWVGGGLLVVLALSLGEVLPAPDKLILGGLAGIVGGLGLMALYRGLAVGRMGVVAPVAAVVAAVPPIVVGGLVEGAASSWQFLGFGVALVAVWLLSAGGGDGAIRAHELGLAGAAGVGFGLFFVLIGRVSDEALLWPLVAARATSVGIWSVFVGARRPGALPTWGHLPIVVLAGVFDTGGNAFFALAARAGRLDISAVLSSLYPAATVFLARLVLKERLAGRQWVGVLAALVALGLIAW